MSIERDDPLDRLLALVDADLNAFFAPARRAIDRALGEGKVNVPRLERRMVGSLASIYGFTEEEAERAALTTYLRGVLSAARTLGAGEGRQVDLAVPVEGEREDHRLRRAGARLLDLLRINIRHFVRRGTPPAEAGRWMRDFLTIDGARTRIGAGGDHGLYEVRRLFVTGAAREYGVGLEERAEREGLRLRWTLHPSHVGRDECDVKARRDVGYGPGVYPPGRVPGFPSHPH